MVEDPVASAIQSIVNTTINTTIENGIHITLNGHDATTTTITTTGHSSGHDSHSGTDHGDKNGDHHSQPPTVVLFIFGSCAAGALVRTTLKRLPLPYTVILMVIGVLFGLISNYDATVLSYTTIVNADPHVIMHVFLPVLIFEAAFAMETHTFVKVIYQVVLLALPGLAVATFLTALFAMNVFDYGWSWGTALMFGSILSATDPVAVVALLKELGASKQLATMIEGESLLNDGAAIVFFEVFLLMAMVKTGVGVSAEYVISYFMQVALGGPAWGFLMGKLTVFWLVNIFNDALTEITITLAATYVTFYCGEIILGVSGVLAVVVLGLVLSAERTSISPEVETFLHRFWEMLAYLCNTLIFILVGVVITQRAVQGMDGSDWFYMISLYCAINIIRGMTIAVFSPILQRIGYGLKWQSGAVMTWGGLRGAVGLLMALNVAQNPGIDQATVGNKILFHTAGIVMLTLLLNATTISRLLKILGMSDISGPKRMAMATAVRTLKDWANNSLHVLKTDRFLADADWEVVKKYTEIKDPYHTMEEEAELENLTSVFERTSKCPTCATDVPNEPTKKEVEEMKNEARLRTLKAQKTSYSRQFEHGMLSRDSVRKLAELAEIATDQVDGFINIEEIKKAWEVKGVYAKLKEKLESWKYNKAEFKIPMPNNKYLQILYKIASHEAFEATMFVLIVLNMIPIIWEVILEYEYPEKLSDAMSTIGFPVLNYIFIAIYIFEAVVKGGGFGIYYLKDHWNQFDLVIIVGSIVDLILDWTVLQNEDVLNHLNPAMFRLVKIFRLLRVLRSLRLVKGLIPQCITWVNGRINIQLRFGYDVGMGYVMGEEEVLKLLDHMIDNDKIASEIKEVLEDGRLEIIKGLGLLARKEPGVAVSVKTQQAARRILNNVRDKIMELRGEGILDEGEAGILSVMIETRMKRLLKMPAVIPPPPPERVVGNLEWVNEDQDLIAYIKQRKLEYSREAGKEVETTEYKTYSDYLTTGNVIGEMALLTGSSRRATIVCETAVQAYYIKLEAMITALELYTEEPSLEYRLWRVCAMRQCIDVFTRHPNFYGWSQAKIRMYLEKAIVIDLSHQTEFEMDPTVISDLVLANGCLVSQYTHTKYQGPIYIPVTVDKLQPCLDEQMKPIVVVVPREGTTSEKKGSATNLRRMSTLEQTLLERKGSLERMSSLCLRHASKERLGLQQKISDHKIEEKKKRSSRFSRKVAPLPETASEERMTEGQVQAESSRLDKLPPIRIQPLTASMVSQDSSEIDFLISTPTITTTSSLTNSLIHTSVTETPLRTVESLKETAQTAIQSYQKTAIKAEHILSGKTSPQLTPVHHT